MTRQLVLTTEGYKVIFSERKQAAEEYFYYDLDFISNSEIAPIAFMQQGAISQRDLIRLADYLQAHIVRLKTRANAISHPFVTYDGFFQLEALEGWIDPEQETKGSFSLLFLVDVGQPTQASRAKIGGQSTIHLKAVEEFATSLRELAINL